jgi:hypothetical protein
MKLLFQILLGLALLASLPAQAQQNIVTDGSFDQTSTGDNGFAPYWSTQAASSGSFFYVDGAPPSYNGTAYFGSTGGFDYISQSLPTTIGTTYQISYDLATSSTDPNLEYQDEFVANYGGTVGPTQSGTTILGSPNYITGGYTFEDTTYTETETSNTEFDWNFTATSISTNLNFGSFNGPQYFFLENVSVVAVPEPSQWGFFVFLALAGFVTVRKFRFGTLTSR